MAEHLALMFGTEKDKVNCPFYFKIGACRHGDTCTRLHNRPLFSQTLCMQNMYISPERIVQAALAQAADPPRFTDRDKRYHFDDFYEDIYEEMVKFGDIEEMRVCANLSDHLAGNVYIKFYEEEAAQQAFASVQERFYEGRPIKVEFSPVTDFGYAKCRPFERNMCDRGDFCNFMHVRRIGNELFNKIHAQNRSQKRGLPSSRDVENERYGNDRAFRSASWNSERQRAVGQDGRWNQPQHSPPRDHYLKRGIERYDPSNRRRGYSSVRGRQIAGYSRNSPSHEAEAGLNDLAERHRSEVEPCFLERSYRDGKRARIEQNQKIDKH
mmetsp:Transcript_4059/g.7112  ORF Transcript_4059/g.7112 Transcript_4059/m.7112 type:complete len:325 (+) Transcript_4059:316-1290(+)